MVAISPLALTIIGILVAVLGVFILTRKVESAIFWAVLLGPAIGTSFLNAIIQLVSGEISLATANFSITPFVIAPIDKAFFSPESGQLVAVGIVILFLWIYVLAHWLTKWRGIWGIPILPSIIFVLGLMFPNLRMRIANMAPGLTFLLDAYMGIGILVLVSIPLFIFAYFVWRRGYTITVPMSQRIGGRP